MARYVESVCKLCRREGEKLFLKGARCYADKCAFERRPYPPGQHGQRRSKISDYGVQLREKQKLKRIYGLHEQPMKNLFTKAISAKGVTGDNLLSYLERRFDNVVYKMGLAATRTEARQLVRHNHFTVNGKKANIPSMMVAKGDTIAVADGSKSVKKLTTALETNSIREIPVWLSVDKSSLRATIVDLPKREDVTSQLQERLVVELYSK